MVFNLTTGLKDFDLLFDEKGITVDPSEGTSILIEGSAGLGKTTLSIQLSSYAVSNKDTSCIYYSFEQSHNEIERIIKSFGWSVQIDKHVWEGGDIGKFKGNFNIIGANAVIGLDVETSLRKIEKHVAILKKNNDKPPIIVLDSIGAITSLIELERPPLSRFINELRSLEAILILVRERSSNSPAPSEYITNVVINLMKQYSINRNRYSGETPIPHTLMEIKKTRNQKSRRGPHEFKISQKEGFVVYPSLQSIATESEIDFTGQPEVTTRATFGIYELDIELGIDAKTKSDCKLVDHACKQGMPYGQSLLVKGRPGSYKTELGVKFLLQDLEEDKNNKVIFVSCRLDKNALYGLEIYKDNNQKNDFIKNNLEFIDARHPFKTPAQILAEIRAKVENPNNATKVRRAVIFGIGMLDTLPAFKNESLTFLQVLINYFRNKKISGVFIDWPQEAVKRSGELIRPTELAGDFIAGAIEISPEKNRFINLKRKDHRFVNKDLGYLRLIKNKLMICEEYEKPSL